MQKNICSEVSLENPYFKLKIGTINKKNPTTFYVEGGTFITPVEDDGAITYKDKMAEVQRQMSLGIMAMKCGKNIGGNFIANIDVADERMKVGKKTYFTFQYYLQQKGDLVPFAEIAADSDVYTNEVLKRIEYSLKENGFALSKTKN